MSTERPRRKTAVGVGVLLLAALGFATQSAARATAVDWPAYLFGPAHHSSSPAATAITPSNAPKLVQAWKFTVPSVSGSPGRQLFASPTVVGGAVYVGAYNGTFYKLNETTGAIVRKRFIGFTSALTCNARGFVASATVVPDPSRGNRLTVYVAAADGFLYALDAADLSTVWRTAVYPVSQTENDYFNWSSATVSGGRIYLGVSSDCDTPLVQGGVRVFSQDSGALLASYDTVPSGSVGGSVWSSVAADPSSVWATTGNADPAPGAQQGDSFSIVRLDGATLAKQDGWTVPNLAGTDNDFGASPTRFAATLGGVSTPMVGACNKNGVFYAWRSANLAAGPVWNTQIALANQDIVCLAGAVFDQTNDRLFVGGRETDIGGTHFSGSIRCLDPATGAVIWARGLSAPVLGTPSLDGKGVLAVGTWPTGHVVFLLNATTGKVIKKLDVGAAVFAQPAFADKYLVVATVGGVVAVYKVGS